MRIKVKVLEVRLNGILVKCQQIGSEYDNGSVELLSKYLTDVDITKLCVSEGMDSLDRIKEEINHTRNDGAYLLEGEYHTFEMDLSQFSIKIVDREFYID